MIERPMPQDILKHETKIIGNFTARGIIFGSISVVICCLGVFSWFKHIDNITIKALLSFIPAVPFALIGFIKIYGVHFDQIIIPIIYDNFICPLKRKKEIHYPEMEKIEKSRYWIREAQKKNPTKKPPKLKCKKSKQYKGIR